jgi:hypothetical protein
MLYQFAYISHQVKCFSETDLQQLMVKARIKNKCLELTGLLSFDKGGAGFRKDFRGDHKYKS